MLAASAWMASLLMRCVMITSTAWCASSRHGMAGPSIGSHGSTASHCPAPACQTHGKHTSGKSQSARLTLSARPSSRCLTSLPARVTRVILCFVVPVEVFDNWNWLKELPKASDCSSRVVTLLQTVRQEVTLLPEEVIRNPKSISPPNVGLTTPEPDDDWMELE